MNQEGNNWHGTLFVQSTEILVRILPNSRSFTRVEETIKDFLLLL